MLSELESQNDAHVEGILGKVKVLKSVSFDPWPSPMARHAIAYEEEALAIVWGSLVPLAIREENRD